MSYMCLECGEISRILFIELTADAPGIWLNWEDGSLKSPTLKVQNPLAGVGTMATESTSPTLAPG